MIQVLRRPVWAIGTVICIALVLLFVRLGMWQLDRLDERRERNDRIESRMELPAEPVELVAEEYRRALVRGEWDDRGTVFIRSRSYGGRPGVHAVTPVVLDDGSAVLVNRGWVPEASAPPVEGPVALEGMVRATQERQGIGPRDPEEGELEQLARLEVQRIQQQYDRELLPFYVELQGEPGDSLPYPLPPPDLSEGPHLGYAGQWFIFAAIGAVGWVILLRRQRPA